MNRSARRAGAAAVLASTVGLAAGAVTAVPAAAAVGCSVAYKITNQWQGGFGADVAVTNLGDPLSAWTVGWVFPGGQTIVQAWNASTTSNGSQVTARNLVYNANLATGATAGFGFNGTWTGTNPAPTAFTLNGTACTGNATGEPVPTTSGPVRTTTPPPTPVVTPTVTPKPTVTPTAPATGPAKRFVLTAFTNSSQSNMNVYTSPDGRIFTLLKANAYRPPSGAVRDPSVWRAPNGTYYIVYTTSPSGASSARFGVARSTDLITWSFVADIPVDVPGTQLTWAPEFFIDTNGSVNVVVSLSPHPQAQDSDFRPYLLTARSADLTVWSGATPLSGGFAGSNHIDTFVVQYNGRYHAFTKNETTKYIEHATASTLAGPYTFVGSGNWSGWGNRLEGPAIARLSDGTWRIYMDGYSQKRYFYADSRNLDTWGQKVELSGGLSGVVRHGTVLRED